MQIQDLKAQQEQIIERVNNLEIPEEVGWQEVLKIQRQIEEFKIRTETVVENI